MKRRSAAMALAVVIGAVVGWFAHDISRSFTIDGCLDSGGAWDYQHEDCYYQ